MMVEYSFAEEIENVKRDEAYEVDGEVGIQHYFFHHTMVVYQADESFITIILVDNGYKLCKKVQNKIPCNI